MSSQLVGSYAEARQKWNKLGAELNRLKLAEQAAAAPAESFPAEKQEPISQRSICACWKASMPLVKGHRVCRPCQKEAERSSFVRQELDALRET